MLCKYFIKESVYPRYIEREREREREREKEAFNTFCGPEASLFKTIRSFVCLVKLLLFQDIEYAAAAVKRERKKKKKQKDCFFCCQKFIAMRRRAQASGFSPRIRFFWSRDIDPNATGPRTVKTEFRTSLAS